MALLSSEDLHKHDFCARFRTLDARYEPFRLTLTVALHEALNAALRANDASVAYEKFMSLAANPGLDIPPNGLYQIAIHHARMLEVIAAYCLSLPGERQGVISSSWGDFQPDSFLLPDGRLRRVVIVERWDQQREHLERFSWRTAADTCVTGRSMLINAIVIGRPSEEGRRKSPWTMGFKHPANGGVRVQKRDGNFEDSWERVWREQTDLKAMDWLGIMQSDGAFENRVISIVEEPPKNRSEVLAQMEEMAMEMGSMRQTRSSCFKLRPCPFASACLNGKTPVELGWKERETLVDFKVKQVVSCT